MNNEWMIQTIMNDRVYLYFNGDAKFRTALHTASDGGTGADVIDGEGSWRPVGYNVMPPEVKHANYTLSLDMVGRALYASNATVYIYTVPNDSAIPAGAVYVVTNNSTANKSIVPAGGVTLQWLQGGTSASGTRTLAAKSVCTIQKYSDTYWMIWGNGLS